jgi:hypothetical protein
MYRAVSLLARGGGARRFLSDTANSVVKAQPEGPILITRQEMGAELKAVRTEIGRLEDTMAGEFKAFRSEMAGEFKAFRSEMAGEFKAFRSEMKSFDDKVAAQFKILGDKMDNQHSYMNAILTGAGATFLVTVGLFGVYTFENSRSIGKLEGRLEESLGQKQNTGSSAVHAPTATSSVKR